MGLNPTTQYVKFVKGTSTAFAALTEKREDTLYFISDSTDSGQLYLGSKLISGSSSSDGATKISELTDVLLSEIGDKHILVYNPTSLKWENRSVSAIINDVVKVMTGASATTAGTAGLVPVPAAGDQNKFLRGDGTWVTLELDEDLTNGVLDTVEIKIIGLRDDIDDLTTLVASLDSTSLRNDITALETRVGSLEDTLNGSDGSTGLVSIVGTLQTDYDSLEDRVSANETSITEIKESVKWYELS